METDTAVFDELGAYARSTHAGPAAELRAALGARLCVPAQHVILAASHGISKAAKPCQKAGCAGA